MNGKILEQVNEMVLGSMFSKDGRYDMDVERSITAGNKVNGALRRKHISVSWRVVLWHYF